MFERLKGSVKRWLRRDKQDPDPLALPEWTVTETEDDESDLPVRFHIQRIEGETTYESYAGDDGAKWVEAWEAYQDSQLTGVFVALDRDVVRATFTRNPSP